MNTFHPYTDDDNDSQNYNLHNMDEDEQAEHYQGYPNQQIDTELLPPDDSFQEFELWEHKNKNAYSPGYEGKPKSRGRYDAPQETANFKEKRKQWDRRKPQGSSPGMDQRMPSYDSNQKDRQFHENSPKYSHMPQDVQYPDVSQINEEEFMESSANVEFSGQRQYAQQNQSQEVEDQSAELLEAHNNFFSNLSKYGIQVENSEEIQQIEQKLRFILQQSSQNKDPNMMGDMQQQLISQLKGFMSQLVTQPEKRPSEVSQPQNFHPQRFQEDQNMHPNINVANLEESKDEHSILQESAISNNRKFQQRAPRNDPFTPDSVSRKYRQSKAEIEIGDRAKRFDAIHNQSPIYPTNAYPEIDEEVDEQKNEELQLSMSERLSHKKWQIRKNAYVEIGNMFQNAARGEKYYISGPNNESYEYNPLEKYQEWLIRMIRDTNLIAQ